MDVPIRTIARRTAVVTAVAGSLAAGAVTIRAAGEWAATSAPEPAPPVSSKTIAQQLADEQTRSADLQARLDAVTANTTDLATALETATGKLSTDATAAQKLQKDLAAAQKKLAALKAQMAATPGGSSVSSGSSAQVVTVTRHVVKKVTKVPTHSKTTASGKPGSGDGGEHDD